jgi:TRAP-type C4-dicarboxylate transport system permease small subunit
VELCRHLFLFAIYFAASAAIQNRAHFKVTLHINKLPKKIQLSLLALTDLIWFIFNCVVVFLFLKLILYMGGRSFISAALHWDMRYVYIVMPFAFILMNIRLIQNWYYHFKHREQGEES